MASGWAALLTLSVGLLALAQVGVLIVATIAARRLLSELRTVRAEVAASLTALDATVTEVGALAAEARETLDGARRTVRQVGAVLGAGRSLVEGALGAALWRRLLGGSGGVGASGSSAVRVAVDAGMAVMRLVMERRAQRRAQAASAEPEPAPSRPALRAGAARRIPPAAGQTMDL